MEVLLLGIYSFFVWLIFSLVSGVEPMVSWLVLPVTSTPSDTVNVLPPRLTVDALFPGLNRIELRMRLALSDPVAAPVVVMF